MQDSKDLETRFYLEQEVLYKEILKSTVQFLLVNSENNVQPFASGVLIKILQDYYIWTASHIIDEKIEKIAIPINKNKVIYPGGKWIFSTTQSNPDKYDIAILKLSPQSVEDIKTKYSFVEQNCIGINHKVINLPLYSINGFPTSLSRPKYKTGDIEPSFFSHSCTCVTASDEYNPFNLLPHINILIQYPKQIFRVDKGKMENKNYLHGMSGCGLWFYEFGFNQFLKPKLVGIFYEWSIKNRNKLIATRTDVYWETIRQKFNCNIETSEIFILE